MDLTFLINDHIRNCIVGYSVLTTLRTEGDKTATIKSIEAVDRSYPNETVGILLNLENVAVTKPIVYIIDFNIFICKLCKYKCLGV